MLQLARAIVGIVSDILRLGVSFLRSSSSIRAENLVLRRQLARHIERGIKPRRVDHVPRVSLALFTRLFDWRDAVVNVRPATIVRWHRLGWRIFWRRTCGAGRPPIPPELRSLIRRVPVHLRAAHGTDGFSVGQSILMQRHVPSRSVAIGRYADGLVRAKIDAYGCDEQVRRPRS